MEKITLWFYRLTSPHIELLLIAATCLFLFLRRRLENRRLWKAAAAMLLLCWSLAVTSQTVLFRPSGPRRPPVLIPLGSYLELFRGANREILRSNLMNALLFYPGGLLAGSLLPRRAGNSRTILILAAFALFSLGIELTQYYAGLGLMEADDILHNSLGAFCGLLLAHPIRRKAQ